MSKSKTRRSAADAERGAKRTTDAQALLDSLDDKTCRSYLGEILAKDSTYAQDFIRRFAAVDSEQLVRTFLRDVRLIADDYDFDDYGYYDDYGYDYRFDDDWLFESRCTGELTGHLEEFIAPLLKRKEHTAVLSVSAAFALFLDELDVEDHEGICEDVLDACTELWTQLFDLHDAALLDAMFEWMSQLAATRGTDSRTALEEDYSLRLFGETCDSLFEDAQGCAFPSILDAVDAFIIGHFMEHARYADKMEQLAERVLDRVSDPAWNEGGEDEERHSYFVPVRWTRWTGLKAQLMTARGCPPAEVDACIEACPPHLDSVRPASKSALARNDMPRAIALLERLIARYGSIASARYPQDAALLLLELYETAIQASGAECETAGAKPDSNASVGTAAANAPQPTCDDDKFPSADALRHAANELRFDILVQGSIYDETRFRSIVETLRIGAGTEWPTYDKRLMAALAEDARKSMSFFAETERYDKLMKAVEASKSHYTWDQYRSTLAPHYPEIYLAKYEAEVRDTLFGASKPRKRYAEGVSKMNIMLGIKGGRKAVERLVAELREKYPKRTALQDELKRLNLG